MLILNQFYIEICDYIPLKSVILVVLLSTVWIPPSIAAVKEDFDVRIMATGPVTNYDSNNVNNLGLNNNLSSTNKRAIIYVNGMATSLFEALNNLNTIRSTLQAETGADSIQLAYNSDKEQLNQLADAAVQHLMQEKNFTEKNARRNYVHRMFLTSPATSIFNGAERYIASRNEENYTKDTLINEHINKFYMPKLLQGNKVVVLAHSQGNFYANRTWKKIEELDNENKGFTSALGIVGMGVPANYIAGNGLYTTNSKDQVINAIRFFSGPQPLPANITRPFTKADILGHSLKDIYLSSSADSSAIKSKIIRDVNTTFSRLQPLAEITCVGYKTQSKDEGGLSTFYTPGINYSGILRYTFNPFNIPNRLKIIATKGPFFIDTAESGFFYYDWSKHGELYIEVTKPTNEPGDDWNLDIECA
ncbi:hypothetical protein H4J50_13010 [Colwellia sp. 6M3]|uniref:hypothetical protein n=1 Tax=Colwellia sp. 6M3 TaxID=2759849 RepID=UPI0015F7798C|nr:hypothetical protein [Colwellia sp. 6M3]MBA6416937.1 hypothetical protein [Colwellia sp. 6M3]